jgi:hypothetical protein
MRSVVGLVALVSALALAPVALAQETTLPGAGGLDLSIRAQSLGVAPLPSGDGASLGLETMKAPTGAGSTRWPSRTTEVARGVYVGIQPLCLPGEDIFPTSRPGARRR